jgi:hypothetical protein
MTNNIDALDIKNQKPVDSSNDSLAAHSKRWTISTMELANKSSSLYLRLSGILMTESTGCTYEQNQYGTI